MWTTALIVLPFLGLCQGAYYGKLLGDFNNVTHELKGTIYAVDDKRILIKDFNYDGKGPDAYFWVGKKSATQSTTANSQGTIIADENGSTAILKAYTSKTIVLNLDTFTLKDIRWISVWCKQFSANFGWLQITDQMTSSLPGPHQLTTFSALAHGVKSGDVTLTDAATIMIKGMEYDGLGPDAFFLIGKGNPAKTGTKIPDETGSMTKAKAYNKKDITLKLPPNKTFYDIDYLSLFCIAANQNFGDVRFNNIAQGTLIPDVRQIVSKKSCETLKDGYLNVAWEIDGADIMIELTGAVAATDYMAFGVSGNNARPSMSNADVAVVWKRNGVTKAVDFFMNSYSLCAGSSGVCPDTASGGKDDVQLLSYTVTNGITTAKYKRPLTSTDTAKDSNIDKAQNTQIIWAVGGINDKDQPTKHHTRIMNSKQIMFGRTPKMNCKPINAPENKKNVAPWGKRALTAKNEEVFTASLGPTGGDRGYKAITGQQSWGIAWYINGLLIPEITVRRGDNVTFMVQGGDNPANGAKYHPFYITDDPIGGYSTKSAAEKQKVKIFAGHFGDNAVKKAVGRYCEYRVAAGTTPETIDSFAEYQKKLTLQCDSGSAGKFVWTVAKDTPDTVYYQCFTHNYLGWKINVVDDYKDSSSCLNVNIFVQLISLFLVLFLTLSQ